MANLIISRLCDMACSYCFARDFMKEQSTNGSPHFITLADFEKRLDFLTRSDIREIRLLGGEPTLHPDFATLLRQAYQRGRRILVFTHGWLEESALAALEALPETAVMVMVNMNAQPRSKNESKYSPTRREQILKRLGSRLTLGYNIHTPVFDLEPLLDLISRTGIRHVIRLGLAQPALNGSNTYLHPRLYPVVGQRIAHFGQAASRAGIKLEFDCGFVPCMFSADDRQAMQHDHPDLGWHCDPIPDLDLDDQAFHCFPLARKVHTTFNTAEDITAIRDRLIEQVKPYRISGIYRECSSCDFKMNGECPGGCLSSTLHRFHPAQIRLQVPGSALQP